LKRGETEGGGRLRVFTEIDHAAVAKKFGLHMRPRTVIVFAIRSSETAMVKTPLLAIDVPLKALVWEDDQRQGLTVV